MRTLIDQDFLTSQTRNQPCGYTILIVFVYVHSIDQIFHRLKR